MGKKRSTVEKEVKPEEKRLSLTFNGNNMSITVSLADKEILGLIDIINNHLAEPSTN